jgi:hypothetical protein
MYQEYLIRGCEMQGNDDLSELSEEPEVAALRAELDACLAAGLVPDGWKHEIRWSADGASMHPAVTAVFIVGSAVACGLAWGWKAGLAAIFAAVGLRMLLSVRGGPRPGQAITESFIPPEETTLEVGVAGHKILDVTRSRPQFSVTRVATPADRRSVRRTHAALVAGFLVGGTLTLLEESRVISPVTYLRTASLIGAAISAGFAVWIWRRIGKFMPLLDPAPAAHERSLVGEVLDTATTGSTTDALSTALLSRLPPKVYRVLLPGLVLISGALGVLVAFNVTPDRSQLWSGLAAATDLTVFVLAGATGVLLAVVSILQRDWAALRSALWTAGLMAVLLLAAKLFGWLDNWGAVIASVRAHVG